LKKKKRVCRKETLLIRGGTSSSILGKGAGGNVSEKEEMGHGKKLRMEGGDGPS